MQLPHVDLSHSNRHLMMDVKSVDGEPSSCRIVLYKDRRATIERVNRAKFRSAIQNVWPNADIADFRDRRDTDFTFGPFDATDGQLETLGFSF